jgi:FlaA1/EpsC-like NDP-sugar epimerase
LINAKMTLFQRIRRRFAPPKQAVIIVGVEYDSYQIHNAIKQHSQRYFTAFFIDDEPWNHRNEIDGAQLRYPVEWRALCRNYEVVAVICPSAEAREELLGVEDGDRRILTTRLLVIPPAEIPQQADIDQWLTRQIEDADSIRPDQQES